MPTIGGKYYQTLQSRMPRFNYGKLMNRRALENSIETTRSYAQATYNAEALRVEESAKATLKYVLKRLQNEAAAKFAKRFNIKV